jgi:hypothetical protein
MEIWFADQKMAALCCELERLRARWGPDGGTGVGRRLQQMKAARTLEALRALPGRCRPCDGSEGNWMIDIDGVAVIVFRLELADDGAAVLGTVVRATVVSVIDHPLQEGHS